MPWLAPIGTPEASGPIDSHEPIWQSSRASRSLGSALTRGKPRTTTTVAVLTRGSDLLPDGRERTDERRVSRGYIGALGRIVAGGEGADAPVVHAGPGSGIGGGCSFSGVWGGGGA